MSKIDNLTKKVAKTIGDENMEKAKVALNKETKKMSDKVGDAISKKIKGVDGDKVERKLNKYIDKYIK